MSFSHQDWNKVILKNPNANKTSGKANGPIGPAGHVGPARHAKPENFDPSNIQNVTISSNELGKAISKARSEKKLKQLELDKLCCFPANTINKYENGTAVVNSSQITKMNSVLGVVLPRPKKIKQKNNE
jgi:ribosome-binding protein aMBF1 (putative translation factor)